MTQRSCPICKKPEDLKMRPFCSKRCADVDLSRWFNDVYAIPEDEKVRDAIEDDE
ncbi:MAG: DNA gyrase inhibitor YacG [Alphaproteobacteria bacterium]|nr:DNA gyrase inhibitor YacG [Alphaproteobacteria bacterium]